MRPNIQGFQSKADLLWVSRGLRRGRDCLLYTSSGGHADGEGDLLSVAMKEVKEESGLVSLKPLSDSPISIEILGVQPHYKKQKYVSAHLHLNYTFLLHNTKEEKLKICPEAVSYTHLDVYKRQQ